jgi:hypothetical protein
VTRILDAARQPRMKRESVTCVFLLVTGKIADLLRSGSRKA